VERTYETLPNKYESGVGSVIVYVRGAESEFAWNAVTPTWEQYVSAVAKTWAYAQVKVAFE
jgi:hypothetical protein